MSVLSSIRCWSYRGLDSFKQTCVASWLFFNGERYIHLEPITRTGNAAMCIHNSADGDANFDLITPDGEWHCEITPCAGREVRAMALSIKRGDRLTVSGMRTYDPDHHILWFKYRGGKNEIHPVESIDRG